MGRTLSEAQEELLACSGVAGVRGQLHGEEDFYGIGPSKQPPPASGSSANAANSPARQDGIALCTGGTQPLPVIEIREVPTGCLFFECLPVFVTDVSVAPFGGVAACQCPLFRQFRPLYPR